VCRAVGLSIAIRARDFKGDNWRQGRKNFQMLGFFSSSISILNRKKAKLKKRKRNTRRREREGGRSEAKGRGKEEGRRKEQKKKKKKKKKKKDVMEKLCNDLQSPRKLEEILEDRICGCDFSPPSGNLPEF